MIVVKNRRVVIPFAKEFSIDVPKNTGTWNRNSNEFNTTVSGASEIVLPFTPLCVELTEVFLNGTRIINPKIRDTAGGILYSSYSLYGNTISFSSNISGSIKVICDIEPYPEYDVTTFLVDNSQGYLSSGISLFHEPIVMTEPVNGYARLSFDRKELVYKPKTNFEGLDSFSYTMINNQGQYGKPKCIYINVI